MNINDDFMDTLEFFTDEKISHKEITFTIAIISLFIFFICYGFISCIFDIIKFFG